MGLFQKTAHWIREALRKRRLSLRHAGNDHEEWHMHISPAGLFSAFWALALLLFILILILVAYTPVLEFLPGYRTEATRSRESVVANIMRLDSMERVIQAMQTYNENISLVLDGRSPVVRSRLENDSLKLDKSLVLPNAADSALRAQMEGEGPYSLAGNPTSRRSVREAVELITPVEGIITQPFDAHTQHLGVKIATDIEAEVAAVTGGTVVLSHWAPEQGYIVAIQHSGNLMTLYRNLSQSSVNVGQRVKAGELIGTTAGKSRDESRIFEFELWSDGKAVDPEAYILF
ncbi:MAG: M23 family metallopeptidase [Alistipes sp.]|nr:M23 family metallopeptidase [Alistipes sp.]